jgi:hypothetical protein
MMLEDQSPHPWLTDRHCFGLKDAAEYDTIGEHIEVVIVPLN